MNLKFLTLSVAASSVIMAVSPMVSTSMSTDNGGTKTAIDAYSDGAGVLMINQASDTKFDNSAMNKLVFKYGDAAKSSNTTLKSQVTVLSGTSTPQEKADAMTKLEVAKVIINPPAPGTFCNDGNANTIDDVWMGSICAGNNVEGQTCTDSNDLTFGDKYKTGVCIGYANNTLCDDNNGLTFGDKYTAGICAGITNGTLCNDNTASTYADKYTNGVCGGTIAASCKDVKNITGTTTSGIYTINPSTVFSAYCDMTIDGGGWTLVYSAINNTAGMVETDLVNLRSNGFLRTAKLIALANVSANIKIKDDAGNYVQTASDNLLPITNLRQGRTLNANGPMPSNYWTGNRVASLSWDTANPGCSTVATAGIPTFYWGCGYGTSAHITTSGTQKGWTDGSSLNLDIWVK